MLLAKLYILSVTAGLLDLGQKVCEIGTKWEKTTTFHIRIQYILARNKSKKKKNVNNSKTCE